MIQLSVPVTSLEILINSLPRSAQLLSVSSFQSTDLSGPWKLAQPWAHCDLGQEYPQYPLLATGGSLRSGLHWEASVVWT